MSKNDGFTLIELIVVIAIIAVLAVVLAPQYIQYIEKGRESNDVQVAMTILDATALAASDPNNDVPSGIILEVIWYTNATSGDPGYILVREAYGYGSSRYSTIVTSTSGYKRQNADLEQLQKGIVDILGGETELYHPSYGGDSWWWGYIDDAESNSASKGNFAFHYNVTTGEVALAHHSNPDVDGLKNVWVNELGVNIQPAP